METNTFIFDTVEICFFFFFFSIIFLYLNYVFFNMARSILRCVEFGDITQKLCFNFKKKTNLNSGRILIIVKSSRLLENRAELLSQFIIKAKKI